MVAQAGDSEGSGRLRPSCRPKSVPHKLERFFRCTTAVILLARVVIAPAVAHLYHVDAVVMHNGCAAGCAWCRTTLASVSKIDDQSETAQRPPPPKPVARCPFLDSMERVLLVGELHAMDALHLW